MDGYVERSDQQPFWFAVAVYFSIEGFIHLTVGPLASPVRDSFLFWAACAGLLSLIQILKSLKNRDSLALSASNRRGFSSPQAPR